jgi:hypothetical protein
VQLEGPRGILPSRIGSDESKARKYSLRFPDAGQPPALPRPAAWVELAGLVSDLQAPRLYFFAFQVPT